MASTSSTETRGRSRVWLPLRLTWIQLALGATLAYPVFRFGGPDGLQSMLVGGALSWVAIVASYFGLLVAFRNVKQFAVLIVLGGFLVRFAILFALLAWISRALDVNLSQTVLWLVGFYMVLVIVEAWSLSTREEQSPEEEE